MTTTPILARPYFSKFFEIDCDALSVGIGSQDGRLVAFFSEKLNEAKKKYLTYDKEFYAIIRALNHWNHYLKH